MTLSELYEIRKRKPVTGYRVVDSFAKQSGMLGEEPKPIGDVAFNVVGQWDGQVHRPFPVPRKMNVYPNPSGYFVFDGTVQPTRGKSRKDKNSTTARLRLASGVYSVHLTARYYQEQFLGTPEAPLETRLKIPPGDKSVLRSVFLKPNHTYPFPPSGPHQIGPTLLRGGIQAEDPARARVQASAPIQFRPDEEKPDDPQSEDLQWKEDYSTDPTGEWVFVIPDNVFPRNSINSAGPPKTNIDVTVQLQDGQSKDDRIEVTRGLNNVGPIFTFP